MESPEDWIGQIVPLSKDSITYQPPGASLQTYLYCKSFSVLFMSMEVWVDTKDFFCAPMLPHTTSNLRTIDLRANANAFLHDLPKQKGKGKALSSTCFPPFTSANDAFL